jgi:hypothetical protein
VKGERKRRREEEIGITSVVLRAFWSAILLRCLIFRNFSRFGKMRKTCGKLNVGKATEITTCGPGVHRMGVSFLGHLVFVGSIACFTCTPDAGNI